jgi:hypothetical protein
MKHKFKPGCLMTKKYNEWAGKWLKWKSTCLASMKPRVQRPASPKISTMSDTRFSPSATTGSPGPVETQLAFRPGHYKCTSTLAVARHFREKCSF